MKHLTSSVLAAVLTLSAASASALDQGRYTLTDLRRDSFGEYKAKCGTVEVRIKTSFCSEMPFNAKGILVWNNNFGSKLVILDTFDEEKRTVCDVTEVWIKQ